MCTCKQKSKKPAGTPGNFNYLFTCTKDDGTRKDIKVTAGNDNEALQLAELECDESKYFKLLKTFRNLDSRNTVYTGLMFPDNNIPGHVLLVADKEKLYSFNKRDIQSKIDLPNGMVSLEIRNGGVGYLCSPFVVGNSPINFQNITDQLVATTSKPQKGGPKQATKTDIENLKKQKPLARTLASVATYWNESCNLSDVEGNNCAHYLSDAFIRAGYIELKKASGNSFITLWCDWNDAVKNDSARPVRALDMKNWFNSMATKRAGTKQSGNGFWAVYQERQSDGQGHVLLYDSDSDIVFGTGGIGYWTWRQFFYQW